MQLRAFCLALGPARPLARVNVSWDDAKQYVAWIAKLTGKPYRLLTEAKWEYAARGGTTTKYFWGEEVGKGNANCYGCESQWTLETAPVGSFNPNAFGLYDMHGNAEEWVENCYHDSYGGTPADGSAGTHTRASTDGSAWQVLDCIGAVRRGGSMYSHPEGIQATARAWSGDAL
jgi:formylglycine-generating enzyme required for sulfatase activity